MADPEKSLDLPTDCQEPHRKLPVTAVELAEARLMQPEGPERAQRAPANG